MTGDHIRLGYNGAGRIDYDKMWSELKQAARKICDDPKAIIAEARRLGAPETCDEGCCDLETYANPYAGSWGEGALNSNGHPVVVIEGEPEDRQIMQMASTDGPIKYCVRRAFVRLLIEAAHKRRIEVNLTVV